MLTADTKTHKFDGVVRSLQAEKKNPRTIGIVEFSRGKKASKTKDIDDQVKLGRNAVRVLNKLLEKVPCRKARVYTIQCVSKYHIRILVYKTVLRFTLFLLRWTNSYTIYGSTPSVNLPV